MFNKEAAAYKRSHFPPELLFFCDIESNILIDCNCKLDENVLLGYVRGLDNCFILLINIMKIELYFAISLCGLRVITWITWLTSSSTPISCNEMSFSFLCFAQPLCLKHTFIRLK